MYDIFILEFSMDRYNLLNSRQKQILDRVYEYLGFNEIVSFEEYIKYFFLNVKYGTNFDHMLNRNFDHIVSSFVKDYPEYKGFKCYWLTEKNALDHMKTGEKEDFDPKGLLRFYVKKVYRKLSATKI